ncbi:response regulator [Draconibacterium halophilum]|uniref:Response regulator n=1 Tax=Draconibacterium halophilum TaxID=2706887 RepID=A0A6C0RHV0_9BACT|nr:response regulator [Draconibacterium halophilum]QIA09637.1 response regulator [Draconibacterium halophilum]
MSYTKKNTNKDKLIARHSNTFAEVYTESPKVDNPMETNNPSSESDTRKLKILLAEDDVVNQKLFSYMLQEIADELIIASTGVAAIKLFKENTDLDLILMDLKMPEMDGYEAVKNIRELDKTVKIFAVSAFAPETQGEAVNGNDFNDYVSKPIRKADLLKIISKYF